MNENRQDKKLKDKIEKLLNLSMSDNEHEAAIALEKALALMNEHNITEDEVYRQKMISHPIEFDYYRIPSWIKELHVNISYLSGCVFAWRHGMKKHNFKASGNIAGRERDVHNALYLISFLTREVVKAEKTYRVKVKKEYKGAKLTLMIKSFKLGLIQKTVERLYCKQNDFFSKQTGKGLICVDLESKLNESLRFINENNKNIKEADFNHKVDKEALSEGRLSEGRLSAEEIELNQAVAKQEEIKTIG